MINLAKTKTSENNSKKFLKNHHHHPKNKSSSETILAIPISFGYYATDLILAVCITKMLLQHGASFNIRLTLQYS
jgi:hypothetical protein